MDRDEDVVMEEAGPSTSTTSHGEGRPPSTHHTGGGGRQPAHEEPNGTTAARAITPVPAPSLMGTFQEKVVSPGNLIKEVEAHQTAVAAARHKTGEVSHEDIADSESGAEVDSDMDVEAAEDSVAENRLLPIASLPTGLCYDIRMRYHCEVRPTLDVHPEDPRRIYYIYKELCKAGLVDDVESVKPLVAQPLLRIDARDATPEEIALVHDPGHYVFVKSTEGKHFYFPIAQYFGLRYS